MEVHHHAHSSRQKWKNYFWEFFMLFLAVFCGYQAERILEHRFDHNREIKYIRTLVADIKKDLSEIHRLDTLRLHRERKLDTLINLLGKKDFSKFAKDIYRLVDTTDGYESFLRNDRTIQQLKNAAGMRLIDENVAEAIMNYDNYIISEVDWNNRTEAGRIDHYKKQRFELLDVESLMRTGNKDTTSLRFLAVDAKVLNMIRGDILQVKRISETNRNSADSAKAKAQELLRVIDKEYHIH